MKQKTFVRWLFLSLLSLSLPAQANTEQPQLQHDKVTVTTSEGLDLAAFVTRSSSTEKPLPALFLTQWVSCGSIAPKADRISIEERVAVEAGYALIRIDRSGSGESEGPGCDKLDYDTEVRHYREAFDQLSNHPWVNPEKMAVMGSSLGSTTAPLVALGKPVIGVIVQGAGALTYYERMLHFDRIQLEREKDFKPEQIHQTMIKRMEFQQHYLHERKTPEQIATEYPHLAGVWASLAGTDAAPHYGRPYAWHWQAAKQNWLAAWAKIEAPIMVVYGGYEQFESRHGHRIIVDTVNRLRPGTATWLEIPQAGHGLRVYPNKVDAFARENGERKPELFVDPVSGWLRKVEQDTAQE